MIDYRRVVEYTHASPTIPTLVESMNPMGESDVKFTRYAHAYGNLVRSAIFLFIFYAHATASDTAPQLVHAIDGDYMMIALLYYARTAAPTSENRIHIYRQLATPIGAETPKRARVVVVDTERRPKPKMVWFVPLARADAPLGLAAA